VSPVGNAIELPGYLCEEDDGVPRRVWQQRLVAVDHERGEGGGEQSGLRRLLVSDEKMKPERRVMRTKTSIPSPPAFHNSA
jgi:hypothetical protein